MKRIYTVIICLLLALLIQSVYADEVDAITELQCSESAIVDEASGVETAFIYIYTAGIMIASVIGIGLFGWVLYTFIWPSLRFNYHLYIEYGTLALASEGITDKEKTQRQYVADQLASLDSSRVSAYAWFTALGAAAAFTGAIILGILLWPLAIIMMGPSGLIRLIAWRKRRKTKFLKELKGEDSGA